MPISRYHMSWLVLVGAVLLLAACAPEPEAKPPAESPAPFARPAKPDPEPDLPGALPEPG